MKAVGLPILTAILGLLGGSAAAAIVTTQAQEEQFERQQRAEVLAATTSAYKNFLTQCSRVAFVGGSRQEVRAAEAEVALVSNSEEARIAAARLLPRCRKIGGDLDKRRAYRETRNAFVEPARLDLERLREDLQEVE